MIVLDTNVVSAITSRLPPQNVLQWLNGIPPDTIALTSVNVFELRFGIELLKDAVARERLSLRLNWFFERFIGDRILPFNAASAERAAVLAGWLQRVGRPVGREDTLIAGICLAHGATLATRNVRHFADAGVALVDPWGAATDT